MFKPRTAEEKLLLSTVRIETDRCTATGFFFGLQNGRSDVLITSRHVIEGSSHGTLRLHNAVWKDENCNTPPTFEIDLENFENLWIGHPDEAVDLVALPSEIIDDAASDSGTRPLDNDRVDHGPERGPARRARRRRGCADGRLSVWPVGPVAQPADLLSRHYGQPSGNRFLWKARAAR